VGALALGGVKYITWFKYASKVVIDNIIIEASHLMMFGDIYISWKIIPEYLQLQEHILCGAYI
jgi:hypothetical protein